MTIIASIILPLLLLGLVILPAAYFSWIICAVALTASGIYFLISCTIKKSHTRPDIARNAASIHLLYGIILALVLLTLLPLPNKLSIVTGPQRYKDNRAVSNACQQAEETELIPRRTEWFTHTRNRAGTLRIALLIIAAFSVAALTSLLKPGARIPYLRFLTLIGALIATAAIAGLKKFPQGDTLWWILPVPHSLPGPVACFRHRNHLAGFLALLSPLTLALLNHDLRKHHFLRALLSLASFAVLSAGIALTASRSGVIAAGAGLLATLIFFILNRRYVFAGLVAVLAILTVIGIIQFSDDNVKQRLATLKNPTATLSGQTRMETWHDSLRIWRDYPLTGTGLNGFRSVFPRYRSSSSRAYMTHADNEYVQLLVETGLLGTMLTIILFYRLTQSALRNRTFNEKAVIIGSSGALITALTTACFEYALHIPLYALTAASITATLLPPLTGSDFKTVSDKPAWLSGLRSEPVRWAPLLAFGMAALLSVASINKLRMDWTSERENRSMDQVRLALTWTPTSWQSWYDFGRTACMRGDHKARLLGEQFIAHAAECDPNNYPVWLELGKLRLSLNDIEGARSAFARVRELREWVPIPEIPVNRK